MKFIITIETKNKAFRDGRMRAELADILAGLPGWAAEPRRGHEDYTPLFDTNGNQVGDVLVYDEDAV